MTRDQFDVCIYSLALSVVDCLLGADAYQARLAGLAKRNSNQKQTNEKKERDHEVIVMAFLNLLASNITEDGTEDPQQRKLKEQLLTVRYIERCKLPTWQWRSSQSELEQRGEQNAEEFPSETADRPLDVGLASWGQETELAADEEATLRVARKLRKKKKRAQQRLNKRRIQQLQGRQQQKCLTELTPLVCCLCSRASAANDKQVIEGPLRRTGTKISWQRLVIGCDCQGNRGLLHIQCLQTLAKSDERLWRRCPYCSLHWANGDVRLQLARAWCDHTARMNSAEPERIRALNHLVLVLRLSGRRDLLEEAAKLGAKSLELLVQKARDGDRHTGITTALGSAMVRLADVYTDLGDTTAALSLKVEALKVVEKLQAADSGSKSSSLARRQLTNTLHEEDQADLSKSSDGTLGRMPSPEALAPTQNSQQQVDVASSARDRSVQAVVSDPSGVGLTSNQHLRKCQQHGQRNTLVPIDLKRHRPRLQSNASNPSEPDVPVESRNVRVSGLNIALSSSKPSMSLSLPKVRT